MKNLDDAIGLAEKLGHVFVATADSSGMPHVAAAAQIKRISDGQVALSAWFCPGTVQTSSFSLKKWLLTFVRHGTA
jgi:hypothetical protein